MTRPARRRGAFEGFPRAFYRRTRAGYVDALAVGMAVNGLIVAAFGLGMVALYVDLTAAELALFGAALAAGYLLENVVAGLQVRRVGAPIRAWAAGDRRDAGALQAWSAAASLPVALVVRPVLYVI